MMPPPTDNQVSGPSVENAVDSLTCEHGARFDDACSEYGCDRQAIRKAVLDEWVCHHGKICSEHWCDHHNDHARDVQRALLNLPRHRVAPQQVGILVQREIRNPSAVEVIRVSDLMRLIDVLYPPAPAGGDDL